MWTKKIHYLVDVSDFHFFRSGRGPRRREGGGSVFFLKNPGGGGLQKGRGGRAGRVSAANWGVGGGG